MPEPETRSPIADAALSLILVARDVGASLKEILPKWHGILQARKQPFEILLVDAGSTDDITQQLAELSSAIPEMQVVRDESGRGFGAALRAGLALARHPLLCYCTADEQYDPADLSKMLEAIDAVDLVVGYRVGTRAPRWLRVAGMVTRGAARVALGIPMERSPCWLGWPGMLRRWFVRWTFGVFVCDPDCAFRLCRREVLANFPLQSDGAFVHTEIIAKANFMGAYIAQVPVAHRVPAPKNSTGGANTERPRWRDMHRVFQYPVFVAATGK